MSKKDDYMDGVHVKISEKYKPPKRIPLPSYSQRNRTDAIHYDFQLEQSVIQKLSELRDVKRAQRIDRERRLNTYTAAKCEVNKLNNRNILQPVNCTMNTTDVLTPMPVQSVRIGANPTPAPACFNISDFETETNPFDSVELKTLNDYEELAQVLACNNSYNKLNSISQSHGPQPIPKFDSQLTYQTNNNQYGACTGSLTTPFLHTFDEARTKSRSVPSIMQELQTDLNNFKLDRNTFDRDHKNDDRVSEQDAGLCLSGDMRRLAEEITSMGFPAERVSRVLMLIGDDKEKVVLHLIALNELLDIGFAESEVSQALLKFDNNRDQALEYLIS